MNNNIIEIPKIQTIKNDELLIVKKLDGIRFDIEEKGDEYFEFYWFAREYPRFYKYHIDNIKFRLNTIKNLYEFHQKEFLKIKKSDAIYEMSVSVAKSPQIYWEFEAFLNAISAALDVVSRISGLAYAEQTPISLNKITKKKELIGIVDVLRKAKTDWIDEMKDYRDCFVHYTPVDSKVYVTVYKSTKSWKMWCKIPTNPNIRNAEKFKFSKKRDLLSYSNNIFKRIIKLDKQIANTISELYSHQEYPKRIDNLFNIGQRSRK
jgi:hypothetical protein